LASPFERLCTRLRTGTRPKGPITGHVAAWVCVHQAEYSMPGVVPKDRSIERDRAQKRFMSSR